jgi:hypothetical protein
LKMQQDESRVLRVPCCMLQVSALQEELHLHLQQQRSELNNFRTALQQQLGSRNSSVGGVQAARAPPAAVGGVAAAETAVDRAAAGAVGETYALLLPLDQQQQQQAVDEQGEHSPHSLMQESSGQCFDSELSFVVSKHKIPEAAAAAAAASRGAAAPAAAAAAATTAAAGGTDGPLDLEGQHVESPGGSQQQQHSRSSSHAPSAAGLAGSCATSAGTTQQQQQQQGSLLIEATLPQQQQQQQQQGSLSPLVLQLQAELGGLARELEQLKRSQQQQGLECCPGSPSSSLQQQQQWRQRPPEPFAAAGPLAHELQALECRLLKALRLESQAQQHLLDLRVSASQERTQGGLADCCPVGGG